MASSRAEGFDGEAHNKMRPRTETSDGLIVKKYN